MNGDAIVPALELAYAVLFVAQILLLALARLARRGVRKRAAGWRETLRTLATCEDCHAIYTTKHNTVCPCCSMGLGRLRK